MAQEQAAVALLISGGLDSAILLGDLLRQRLAVYPLFVKTGLFWESVELVHLKRFLLAVQCSALKPLHILELHVADLYGDHWSLTGRNVPDAESSDEAVYLPGRNVLLLAKGMIWSHLHGVPELALGVLGSNPFPDATPRFFAAFQEVVNMAIKGAVEVVRPFAGLGKREVMLRGRELPLDLTFSCIQPAGEQHCGQCNKCAERRHAFANAGLNDKTLYAREGTCTA
jgi:7-cyano-7-deazaguanine synthase